MKPYEKLWRFWAEMESGVVPGQHAEADVVVLEQRYGVSLPDDFRDYLLRSCPVQSDGMDMSSTEWWGFKDIRSISEECGPGIKDQEGFVSADKSLFFADFLIWAPAWAIICGDDENRGRILAAYDLDARFVADSFAEFVERYVVEPADLAWLPSSS